MSTATPARFPALPPDEGLPGAEDLLCGAGEAAVTRFLRARGWEPERLRPVQALYRPGRSLALRFDATARRASGPASSFTLTVEAGREGLSPPAPPPGGGGRLPQPVAADGSYLVWAYPYDPALPGLVEASCPGAVRRRLPVAAGAVRVQPLRYRPRRRAVLRYDFGDGVLFAKVLPPARARAALESAVQLRPGDGSPPPVHLALPVGGAAPGTLLVPMAGGRCLRDLLWEGARLPSPERVGRIPDDLDDLARRAGPPLPPSRRGSPRLDSAERAAEVIVRLLPALAAPVGRVVEAIAGAMEGDARPQRLVHGDLYEAQVFVAPDESLALVDLDDLGLGDPLLDAANFGVHLLALALSPAAPTGRLLAYRELLRQSFLARLDASPRSLAWREAYAMLLLATGPFRVLRPDWPAAVAQRVENAERLLEA